MLRIAVFCVCFLAIAPFGSYAITDEQKTKIRQHFEKLGLECIKDFTISEDDIKDLRAKKAPSGENGPCFVACLMKKSGLMNDKGDLQNEGALEMAKKVFEDDDEIKNVEDYLHSCAHVNSEAVSDGEKGCDRAILSLKCMTENASKFGFDL